MNKEFRPLEPNNDKKIKIVCPYRINKDLYAELEVGRFVTYTIHYKIGLSWYKEATVIINDESILNEGSIYWDRLMNHHYSNYGLTEQLIGEVINIDKESLEELFSKLDNRFFYSRIFNSTGLGIYLRHLNKNQTNSRNYNQHNSLNHIPTVKVNSTIIANLTN